MTLDHNILDWFVKLMSRWMQTMQRKNPVTARAPVQSWKMKEFPQMFKKWWHLKDIHHFVTSKQVLPIISNNHVIPVTLWYTLFLQLLLSIHYLCEELSVKRQAISLSKCITMESAEIWLSSSEASSWVEAERPAAELWIERPIF